MPLPTSVKADTNAIAINVAIKPYSIAVAPVSSLNRFRMVCLLDREAPYQDILTKLETTPKQLIGGDMPVLGV